MTRARDNATVRCPGYRRLPPPAIALSGLLLVASSGLLPFLMSYDRHVKRLTTLLVLVLVVAACSSEEAVPTIPSSEDVVTTSIVAETTTTEVARLGFEEAVAEFTDCMRDEGIEIPDVRFDAEGRPILGEIVEDLDLSEPAFQSALGACAGILTRAGALELSTDPELQAVVIDQLTDFSACMRDNGVETFPDPTAGFTGTGSPYPLGLIPFDDPEFEDAATACQEALGSLGLDS